jgi:hypothetical protein
MGMRDSARIDAILKKMEDKGAFRDFLYKHLVGKYEGDQLTIHDELMIQEIDVGIVPTGIPPGFVKYWKDNPDFRFGQALINVGLAPDELSLFYCEDPEV